MEWVSGTRLNHLDTNGAFSQLMTVEPRRRTAMLEILRGYERLFPRDNGNLLPETIRLYRDRLPQFAA